MILRPGIQGLLQDAQAGQFDIALAEALDRISRDQADIATLYKHLKFAGVPIVTLGRRRDHGPACRAPVSASFKISLSSSIQSHAEVIGFLDTVILKGRRGNMGGKETSGTSVKFDWHSTAYEADPKGYLKDLANRSWIGRTELGYAVFRRDQAREILRADVPISTHHIPEAVSPYLAARTKEPLLRRSGPEHVRLRGMLSRVLRARVIEDLRPQIREIFCDLLDGVIAKDEADLVADLFDPYPARVLAPMLGIPDDDIPMVAEWVSTSAQWVNVLVPESQLAEIEASWRQLETYLLKLLAERRGNLREDILSELIREMEGSSEEEVVGIAAEMTRAGLDTTRRQLACTMYALIQHPEQWRRLSADPELAPKVVEEGLRYAPIIHALPRQMIEDSQYFGMKSDPGTVFTVMPMAANFDPAGFQDPETFDVSRSPCPHFTFGSGSHSCVGAPLARMEMTEAFRILAERVDSVELTGDVPRSHVSEGWVPVALPVRINAR